MSADSASGRKEWRTAIADFREDSIIVRGYDLMELIDKLDFAGMSYLLLSGQMPNSGQVRLMNAIFVSVAEHGISPSATTTRFLAASGVPIQCAVAAGIMTFGDIHGGAGQEVARLIQAGVERSRVEGTTLTQVAEAIVEEQRAARKYVPGYGHPQHPAGDPRAPKLLGIADAEGISGPNVALGREIEAAIERRRGRRIPMNIDGALGCLTGDLGIDWRLARALITTPRGVGLAAHAYEEQVREPGWRQIKHSEVEYDGPVGETFEGL